MTTISETVREHNILVNHHMQAEGRGLQIETRCFPINQKTRYKRLHKQVRKSFGLKESFDLAYPMHCHIQQKGMTDHQQDNGNHINNTRWISISGDHDITHILSRQRCNEEFELKIVPSANNMSMNPFRRGLRKGLGFMEKHGPDVLETISFVTSIYETVHPAILRITNGKRFHR
ncbi:hypothetical protein BDC45DRAFT_530059 [Circinella umbellata]|nr:hypothetical protein BDC45DRAFT_530059 [Circinella umbellata]